MKVRNAICYSFSLSAQEPMAYIRLIAPFQQAGINIINGFNKGNLIREFSDDIDVVIIQREFPSRFNDYQAIVEVAKRNKKPIVFELDDLLFSLPKIHPDRLGQSYAPLLLPMLQALMEADLVTVSSPKLRDTLVDFNQNIEVLPNYFDDKLWNFLPPGRKDASAENLIIGFMGTKSHGPDLDFVAPVLKELIERYPEKLKFHFWGAPPPAKLAAFPQVQWSSKNFQSYEDFAAYFQSQTVDIFIAPLLDHLFNQCKSSIKFFEYSALGVPGVYSRIEPYEAVVTHEHNGLLAGTLDEWYACLTQLIEDDELRMRLATNAQTSIKEKWLLSQNAFRWAEALQNACESAASNEQASIPIASLVNSINPQLIEAFRSLKGQVSDLSHKVATLELNEQILHTELKEAKKEIEELKTEILGYALSSSWRMTRPLRIIGRSVKRLFGDVNV